MWSESEASLERLFPAKTDELKEKMKEYKARRRLVNACTKFLELKVENDL